MQRHHDIVLRDAKLSPSWIAFQQTAIREARGHFSTIQTKLDTVIANQAGAHPSAPPAKVWTIGPPTQHFQDRPEMIAAIDAALARNTVTALTALHGLGGIGKSQLARRFAEQRSDRYQLGVWLEAETTLSLLGSLAALAPLLGLPPEQDQPTMAARVLNTLCAREPWLVVFDNAISAADLREYLQKLHGNGHVLITSRNEQWDSVAQPVSVTQWSVEESSAFLLKRTGQTDAATAKALARDLDGLVLALEHAASYMLAGDGMTLAAYHQIWKQKLDRTHATHEYPVSVAATLGLSIDRVQQKSPLAYDLLRLFAWLAPDRIPKKELLEAGAAKLPEALGAAFADHDSWSALIETLGQYSLLRRERAEDQSVSGYFMHRVTQQVMRDRLAEIRSAHALAHGRV